MLPEKHSTTNTHQLKSGQTPRRTWRSSSGNKFQSQPLRKTQGNADQDSKFVTVIHPKKLGAITTKENNNRESLVSWLFLIGSLMFLFDGAIELTEGISIHVLLHLPASVLFVVGSVLFIPTDKNN